jgi:hypothetical protein
MNAVLTDKLRIDRELSIGALYETFAPYLSTERIGGCDCCHTENEIRLLSGALKTIPIGILEEFGFSAMLTWGDVRDFKRILPRLYEHLAWSKEIRFAGGMIGKLKNADWKTWPEPEQIAIKQYLSALFLSAISMEDGWLDTKEIYLGLKECEFDFIAPLNRELDSAPFETFSSSIANLILSVGYKLMEEIQSGARIDRRLIDWLVEDRIAFRLERTYDLLADDSEFAKQLLSALEMIEWLRL